MCQLEIHSVGNYSEDIFLKHFYRLILADSAWYFYKLKLNYLCGFSKITRGRHPCPRRESNPQLQEEGDCRPSRKTALPRGSAVRNITFH